MEKKVEQRPETKTSKKKILAAILSALLAVSLANAAVIVFQKTVNITVGEPITLSNPNWLPNSQAVSPGQNVNYTVQMNNIGANPYNVQLNLNAVSNGPKGTIRLYLNGTLVITAYFNGNSTAKTYTISPFAPGTNYQVKVNLDIPSDSAGGNVNMTVAVQRL